MQHPEPGGGCPGLYIFKGGIEETDVPGSLTEELLGSQLGLRGQTSIPVFTIEKEMVSWRFLRERLRVRDYF